jgi:hypothetical protein
MQVQLPVAVRQIRIRGHVAIEVRALPVGLADQHSKGMIGAAIDRGIEIERCTIEHTLRQDGRARRLGQAEHLHSSIHSPGRGSPYGQSRCDGRCGCHRSRRTLELSRHPQIPGDVARDSAQIADLELPISLQILDEGSGG